MARNAVIDAAGEVISSFSERLLPIIAHYHHQSQT